MDREMWTPNGFAFICTAAFVPKAVFILMLHVVLCALESGFTWHQARDALPGDANCRRDDSRAD